ncbi:hypothetical protein LPJ61_005974 [Coemansia biformis]|uniref:AB hydrolase-1 domain-containing protein n=1 Tax=Coemansia biformis TaxID=1286918 RepID=A0A9W7XZR1_9FUNG|nr:hypothetical protein LPJ61_005974 [Coemansia biformis]
MNSLTIDSTMPVEPADSPIWDQLAKRGRINIATSENTAPINIYYELFGSGPERVVFVNGMSADRQMWEPNVGDLLVREKYQCLVYDHRGTGHSDHNVDFMSLTTSELAADLKKLMQALGWEKASIVGASMGGMVALEFASQYPQMVRTLTLAVTNAGLTLPPLRGILSTTTANFKRDPVERFERICGALYPQEYLQSPAPEGSGCDTMMAYCVQNAVRRSKYTRPMSFSGFLNQVGVVFRHYVSPARLANLGRMLPGKRILIVTGDEDHMVRTKNSDYLADKIGREHVIFQVYNGAGHGMSSQTSARLMADIDSMITALCSSEDAAVSEEQPQP